jgi:rRNA processing protein Krr1/Pno1
MAGEDSSPAAHPVMTLLAARSVTDLIVLTFTVVVAVSILATGATIAVIEIRDPATDTTAIVDTLTSTVTTIIGALLGLIAGKSEMSSRPTPPP